MGNTIGERIKELRTKNNLKQSDLANVLNVTSQAISRWESNDGTPELNTLASIAKYFTVTTDYLIYGESKKDIDLLNNDLIEAASIFWKSSRKLLNIYWKPCSLDVARTEINLFVITAGHSFHTEHDPRTLGDDLYTTSYPDSVKMQFMKKFIIDDESCYLAICDLATSNYAFKLSQYDKDNNKLFETEIIYCYA